MKSAAFYAAIACAVIVACFAVSSVAHAADMDTPREAFANVPGGQVWLNPGDAYEHDTGLVRDAAGRHHAPITRNGQAGFVSPNGRFVSPNGGFVSPPTTYPGPPSVYVPNRYRGPSPYDFGPYATPHQPRRYPQVNHRHPGYPVGPAYPARPSTRAYGVDVMDTPMTGDAPLAR